MTEAVAEKVDTSTDEKAELLGKIPLFSLLDASERAVLAERIDVERHAKGTTLFNAGDPGDSMYMLTQGTVEVWFKNNTGEKIVLETAQAGEFFGESRATASEMTSSST